MQRTGTVAPFAADSHLVDSDPVITAVDRLGVARMAEQAIDGDFSLKSQIVKMIAML